MQSDGVGKRKKTLPVCLYILLNCTNFSLTNRYDDEVESCTVGDYDPLLASATVELEEGNVTFNVLIKYSDDLCVALYPGSANLAMVQEFCARIGAKPVEPKTVEQVDKWLREPKSEYSTG